MDDRARDWLRGYAAQRGLVLDCFDVLVVERAGARELLEVVGQAQLKIDTWQWQRHGPGTLQKPWRGASS
jgi:hypothetical protein